MKEANQELLSMRDIRPRFKVEATLTIDEMTDKLKDSLQKPNASCQGKVIPGHATLFLPANQQHYWSPQLSLNFEESGNGILIRGLYGPRPEVWTMFVLFYSIIGIAGLVVLVLGLSFLMLGRSVAILWALPALTAVFFTLFLVANHGKKMGKEQIKTLHRFIVECTGLTIV